MQLYTSSVVLYIAAKVTYTASHGNISFQNDNLLPAEAYNIDINNKGIITEVSHPLISAI